jgi:hypothetical protein
MGKESSNTQAAARFSGPLARAKSRVNAEFPAGLGKLRKNRTGWRSGGDLGESRGHLSPARSQNRT